VAILRKIEEPTPVSACWACTRVGHLPDVHEGIGPKLEWREDHGETLLLCTDPYSCRTNWPPEAKK
jgi:hypothetical protein